MRNPQVHYIGVEAMPEPAADASRVLDQVIVGNAEDPLLFRDYVQDVDCLVYGDVLEHLVNPGIVSVVILSCCLRRFWLACIPTLSIGLYLQICCKVSGP